MSKIAVLSGKGGSGKTFVSTNLFNIIENSTYLDCDVEEPNGYIFFKDSKKVEEKKVYRGVPSIDEEKCDGCRKCVDFCRFSALAFIADKPLVFSEICHSCGGCELVCPQGAIKNVDVEVGSFEIHRKNNSKIVNGIMEIGQASAVPLISKVLSEAEGTTIIDCPPGSACSTMEAIQNASYCILVTEPTVFSLHNVKMIVELVELFNIPYGFVINKSDNKHDYIIEDYIKSINKPLLLKIPFSKEIAKITANGDLISGTEADSNNLFSLLKETLVKEGYIK